MKVFNLYHLFFISCLRFTILTLGFTCGGYSNWAPHKTHVDSRDQVSRYECVINLHSVFIFYIKNICFWCLREPSHQDGSVEHLKYIFELMDRRKRNNCTIKSFAYLDLSCYDISDWQEGILIESFLAFWLVNWSTLVIDFEVVRRRIRWKVNTNKTFAGEDNFTCVEDHLMAKHYQFNGILRNCCNPIKNATWFKGIS